MNTTEIYRNAIKVYTQEELDALKRKESEKDLEQEIKADIRDKWLEHPLTQKLLEDLNRMRNKLLTTVEDGSLVQREDSINKMFLVQSSMIKGIIGYITTGKFN